MFEMWYVAWPRNPLSSFLQNEGLRVQNGFAPAALVQLQVLGFKMPVSEGRGLGFNHRNTYHLA